MIRVLGTPPFYHSDLGLVKKAPAGILRRILTLLLFVLAISTWQTASAATVSAYPSNCQSVNAGGQNWTNAANAVSVGGGFSSSQTDGVATDYLQCTGFGFAIPAGAVINGITVNITRQSDRTSNGGSRDFAMRLVKAGVIGTTDRATTTQYTTAFVTEPHGGAVDLWGDTWTAADINSNTFGTAFRAIKPSNNGPSHVIDVDSIQIVVDYNTSLPSGFPFGSCDDFEGGLVNWTISQPPGGTGIAGIAAGTQTVNSPTHSLYLASGQVYVSSGIIDSSAAASPTLTLWVRKGQNGLDGYSQQPEAGEDLQIQYLNSSNVWTTLATLPGGGVAGEIFNLSYPLPADAIHASFQIRFFTVGGNAPRNGRIYDYWHIDDVCTGNSNTASLVAYYAEDEASWNGTADEVIDSSVNGLHGTALNGASTAPAKVCRGGNFDGFNGPVEIADNALLDITSSLTASAWIQPNALPASGLKTILSKDTNFEFHLDTAGEIYWWWNDNNGTVRTLTTSGANITPGNWYHVAITYASGRQRIYVNGVQLASSSFTGNLITNSNPLQIGGDQGIAARLFDGLIDEVRVYAAEQSMGEVIADMNATHTCPTTPLALYHLDESAWGVVTDSSGNGNDGSTSGTVTSANTSPAIAGDPGTCGYASIPYNNSTTTMDAIDSGLDVDTQIGNQGTISFWYSSNRNWNGGGSRDRQLFDASTTANGQKYFQLVLDQNGALHFELEDSADSDFAVSTTTINTAANTWTHIAVTWDLSADRLAIYVNGVLSNSNNINSNGTIGNLNTLFFGDNRSTYLAISATNRSADGLMDEIHIYDLVQSAAQITADMNASHPCGAAQVHHYRILHDGSGLTCNPEAITVQACTDAACTSFYNSNFSVTIDPTGDSANVNDGSGVASLAIRHTTPGAITLKLAGATPSSANATECLNTSDNSASCLLTFHDTGFIVDVPNLTSCATSTSASITAVRKDLTSERCVPAFSSRAETLKLWSSYVSPLTGASAVSVNGANVATAAPGTDIQLNFDANGQSTFSVAYPDAGRVQLNARFDGAGGSADENLVMTGSDTFIAVPAKFVVGSGDANADCTTGDATCTAFTQAGAAFNMSVSAACADNTITPNFIASGITLGHNLVAPSSLLVPGVRAGTLGNGSIDIVDADNGTATIADQSIGEVGVFTLTATLDSYLGITAAPGTHLIEGISNNIGRFFPANFLVTHSQISSCGTFTYAGLGDTAKAGQPFDVIGTVTARNTANNTTLNYVGGFAKLLPANITAIPMRTPPNIVGVLQPGSWSVDNTLSFNNGSSPFTAHARYAFSNLPPVSLAPQTDVYLSVTSNDGDASGNETNQNNTAEYRFGRLALVNAYGPQTSDLDMSIVAQYRNAADTDFVTNSDDSCTPLPGIAGVSLSNWTANLQSGDTAVTAVSPALSTAVGTITLSAPGPGAGADTNDGSVDVTLDATAIPWLRIDSNGDGTYAEDPFATAVFGIYRGDDRFLFWQESR